MRTYPSNSPEAAARIVALAMLADGNVCHREMQALDALHVDMLFLGVDGFDLERGITTHYEPEAMLNRKMVEAARTVVAISDSSKFGKVCLHRIIPDGDLNTLITDTNAPEEVRQASHQLGFELQLA